ncbi:MAG: Asp-tRNA(Asn)/Glu-tRNA(Gln) amidotransferase subunit GatA [Anaerolineales bacterium]|nr:Asp-tRNA(Asn)/Glu-tRNA(Gln) amidotransferase subunit GatA [Anaerolineales bacterium]
MPDLTTLSLTQYSHLLHSGELSSRELTEACLARIDALDPDLQAFLHLDPEGALAQADAADQTLIAARKSGETPHLLTGIPLAIKDVISVAGLPCTSGSKILEGFVPPFDATAVARLRAAGVIIVGKTNTDEFAMGSSTENSAYGTSRNPWDTSRVPGGSSGGSAAAVAARLVPGALGSDTGGSIRQPASFCGVTGIKPTYGRVSRYGLVAYGSSLDCVGAFAPSAADAALIFSTIAGHDPLDATSVALPIENHASRFTHQEGAPLSSLRVGVPKEYFIEGIQPAVETAVRAAIAQLQALGAEIHEISLPHTEYALPVYYLIAPAEASANLARFDGVRYGPREAGETMWDVFFNTRGERFGAEVKRRIMLGTYALSAGYYDAYYGQAQKVRTLIKRDFETAFGQVDVIAAPVAPTTAFKIGVHSNDPLAMYLEDVFTLPANLAGVPGISFPVGFDGDAQQELGGLPIGMQLMGPHFREDVLFRAADAYQGVTDWHTRMPDEPLK